MAFDEESYEMWLHSYRKIMNDHEDVLQNRNSSFSTSHYGLYQSYSNTTILPDTYVGDIQGFDLFVDKRTTTYMVKYNSYYAIIPEHLFDLAYTEMDASELNTFFCHALFDNVDVVNYLTEYLKNKKQYQYSTYITLTDEEREEQTKKYEEEMRIRREEQERQRLQQIEIMAELEAARRATQSLNSCFWGLLLIEDISL